MSGPGAGAEVPGQAPVMAGCEGRGLSELWTESPAAPVLPPTSCPPPSQLWSPVTEFPKMYPLEYLA